MGRKISCALGRMVKVDEPRPRSEEGVRLTEEVAAEPIRRAHQSHLGAPRAANGVGPATCTGMPALKGGGR